VADLEERLEAALLEIGRHLAKTFVTRSGPGCGLEKSVYLGLIALAQAGPLPVKGVASALGLDASTASRLVENLSEAGLVTQERSPQDGRVRIVKLSPRGRAVLASAKSARISVIKAALADWEDGRREAFVKELETLACALARLLGGDGDRHPGADGVSGFSGR
jgi:DNA-binding MarR family transcriptional regulator